MPERPLPCPTRKTALRAAALGLATIAWPALADPVPRAQVEAALPQLRAMAEQAVASGGVPGLAIVVVHDDEVVFLEGFGLRAMGKPETVDGDTVFQLASMSKPISSTVVAALVGEGVVAWETRIRDLDPGFALHDPYPTAEVTVRDLFNHRSGLPGTSGDDIEAIGFDRATVMERLRLVPPSSSFRAGYAYSNAGITAGALAAVRPTGKDWETIAEEKLFGPLGMDSTSYRYADFTGRANAAALHVEVDGAWAAKLTRDATVQAPAGAVSSSARDIGTWMRLELANGALGGEQLIAPEAIAATHVPLMARGNNPITGASSFYGLGWNAEFGRHGRTWGHAGAFSVGARTLVTLYPDSGLGITVLANAFPTGVPEGLADSFGDLVFSGTIAQDYFAAWNAVYGGLFGPAIDAAMAAYGAPPDPATPALPAAAYLGTYANAYAGEGVVTQDGEALVLALGPAGEWRFPLTHFDRDLFLYYPDPEMPSKPSAVRFTVGPDGRAVSLTAESLDSNGLGTLTRTEP